MKGRHRTHRSDGGDRCGEEVFSSFCTNSLRSPERRKVVQTFRSHRLCLAPPPATGLAIRSRTQVHDCFRRRFSWHEMLRGWGLFSSFCANSLRSPERRKVVQTFRSHRLCLAPPPATGLAIRSRTQVHDCFRRRFSWHEMLRGWGLFSSFRPIPDFRSPTGNTEPGTANRVVQFVPPKTWFWAEIVLFRSTGLRKRQPEHDHPRASPRPPGAENIIFFNDSIRSRCEHRYC